jgi:hypothetical protein
MRIRPPSTQNGGPIHRVRTHSLFRVQHSKYVKKYINLLYRVKSPNLCRPFSPPLYLSLPPPLPPHPPLPKPLPYVQATSRLAALQGDGPEWSTPRNFLCSHICTWMLDNVFVVYLPTKLSFFWWNTPPIYFLLNANCYFSMLNNITTG